MKFSIKRSLKWDDRLIYKEQESMSKGQDPTQIYITTFSKLNAGQVILGLLSKLINICVGHRFTLKVLYCCNKAETDDKHCCLFFRHDSEMLRVSSVSSYSSSLFFFLQTMGRWCYWSCRHEENCSYELKCCPQQTRYRHTVWCLQNVTLL